MSYTESIENLLEEIELHEAPLNESETRFLERVSARYEEEGTLDSDAVAELYELLDRLDDRAGGGSSNDYAYAGAYDDDDDLGYGYDDYSEEEEE